MITIGDKIIINSTYVNNILQRVNPSSPLLQQSLAALGYLNGSICEVLDIGISGNNTYFIRLLPLYQGNPDSQNISYNKGNGSVVYFSSLDTLNNTFETGSGGIANNDVSLSMTVFNNSGSTIYKNQIVRHVSFYQTSCPTVALAVSNINFPDYSHVMGAALTDIPNNSFGYVIITGYVRGINTTGTNIGDEVYLSNIPGLIRSAPDIVVSAVGTVFSVGILGSIYIRGLVPSTLG